MGNSNDYIKHFFGTVATDNNMRCSHIALYMSILQLWTEQNNGKLISISRQQLMALSKIGSKATYHRCIAYLCKREFIKYYPTFNSYIGTKIELLAF